MRRAEGLLGMNLGPGASWPAGDAGNRGSAGGQQVGSAGLVVRVGATLIDAVVVGVVWFIAVWLFLEAVTLTGALNPATMQPPSLSAMSLTPQQYALVAFAAGMLYVVRGADLVYGWSAAGATPGQQILGLRIADARSGGRLSAGRSLVRWLVSELPGIGLLLGVAILFWFAAVALSIFRNRERRGFHDVAAGSVVLRRRGEAAGQGGNVQ
ncbi:MAG: RDD family protein [Candidatus Limnocylindrales bacterium]